MQVRIEQKQRACERVHFVFGVEHARITFVVASREVSQDSLSFRTLAGETKTREEHSNGGVQPTLAEVEQTNVLFSDLSRKFIAKKTTKPV